MKCCTRSTGYVTEKSAENQIFNVRLSAKVNPFSELCSPTSSADVGLFSFWLIFKAISLPIKQ